VTLASSNHEEVTQPARRMGAELTVRLPLLFPQLHLQGRLIISRSKVADLERVLAGLFGGEFQVA
jgi:hypothetical protein